MCLVWPTLQRESQEVLLYFLLSIPVCRYSSLLRVYSVCRQKSSLVFFSPIKCEITQGRTAQRAEAVGRQRSWYEHLRLHEPKTPRLLFSGSARKYASDRPLLWRCTRDLAPYLLRGRWLNSEQAAQEKVCLVWSWTGRVPQHSTRSGGQPQQPVAIVSRPANASVQVFWL